MERLTDYDYEELSNEPLFSELIKRLKRYESVFYNPDGTERVTMERLAELVEADKEGKCLITNCKTNDLRELYDRLSYISDGDEPETYKSGYWTGHKNGQVELLNFILQDGKGTDNTSESETMREPEAQAALAERKE